MDSDDNIATVNSPDNHLPAVASTPSSSCPTVSPMSQSSQNVLSFRTQFYASIAPSLDRPLSSTLTLTRQAATTATARKREEYLHTARAPQIFSGREIY